MSQQPGDTSPYGQPPRPYIDPQPFGQQQPPPGAVVPYQQPQQYQVPVAQPMFVAAAPAVPKTNGLAVASLICCLVGLIIFPGLLQILALIFGVIAKGQIKRTGEGGAGLATAGIVISAIILGLAVVGVILWIIFAVVLAGAGAFAS